MLFSPCVDGFQSGSPLSSCRWIEPGAVKQKHCSDICQNYLISFSEYPENWTDETLIQCKICEFTQFYNVIKMVYTQSVNTAYHYRWQQFFLSQYCLFNACLLSVLLLFYMSAGTPYHRWTVSFPLHTHKNCGLYHCKKKKSRYWKPTLLQFFFIIYISICSSFTFGSVSFFGWSHVQAVVFCLSDSSSITSFSIWKASISARMKTRHWTKQTNNFSCVTDMMSTYLSFCLLKYKRQNTNTGCMSWQMFGRAGKLL